MEHLGINSTWQPSTNSEKKLVELLQKKHSDYEKLNENCENLNRNCEKLSEKNNELENKLQELERKYLAMENTKKQDADMELENNKKQDTDMELEFHTDENQLAEETEWIRIKTKKNNKKRRMDKSVSPPSSNEMNEVNKKDEKRKKGEKEKTNKILTPPPIIVDKVEKFDTLLKTFSEVIQDDEFTMKVLKNNGAKINPKSASSHRLITEQLNAIKMPWHSYENKQLRPFRVMVKGLHHSWSPEDIIADLQKQGLQAIEAVNKISWKTKSALDMFIVSFNYTEDTKKIQDLEYILNTKIEIETLRSSKLIPQCKRCQSYGHTQKYCAREARCVKCVGKHLTADCVNLKENTKPKCCHCGEEHPANYRGCIVAKELQKLRTKSVARNQPASNDEKCVSSKVSSTRDERSYSNVTSVRNPSKKAPPNDDLNDKLNKILEKLSDFDERLKKLEYINKGAIPKQKLNKNE